MNPEPSTENVGVGFAAKGFATTAAVHRGVMVRRARRAGLVTELVAGRTPIPGQKEETKAIVVSASDRRSRC